VFTFAAVAFTLAAAGTVAALLGRRAAGGGAAGGGAAGGGAAGERTVTPPATGGETIVINPVILPPSIIGVQPVPPSTDPTAPGPDPLAPLTVPQPGQFYQVKTGDMGTRIVGAAYGTPIGGGERVRQWEKLRKHSANQALKRSSHVVWSGDLVPQHAAPGQWPWGSGKKFPVIWIPTLSEVR
jgi:hypothetical protein